MKRLILIAAITQKVGSSRIITLEPCPNRFFCPELKLEEGVLLVAYGQISESSRIIKESRFVAQSLREAGNKHPIAIATNWLSLVDNDPSFQYVIKIREDLVFKGRERGATGYSPQWTTRLIYYASSPFRRTIALDSNAYFCRDPKKIFDELTNYNFIVTRQCLFKPSEHKSSFYPHNFAMAYDDNVLVDTLFQWWLIYQIQNGIAADDQITLSRALRKVKGSGLKFGEFSTLGASSYMSIGTNSYFPAITKEAGNEMPIIAHPFQHLGCAPYKEMMAGSRSITLGPTYYTISNLSTCREHNSGHSCFGHCGSDHKVLDFGSNESGFIVL